MTKDGETAFSWTANPAFGGSGGTAPSPTPAAPKKGPLVFNIFDFVEDLMPESSIFLRNAIVSASSQDNITNNTFDIVIPPSKTALFPTESRYVLKAASEEEMVDWVVAVKSKVQITPESSAFERDAAPPAKEQQQPQQPERKDSDKDKDRGGRKLSSFMSIFAGPPKEKKEKPAETLVVTSDSTLEQAQSPASEHRPEQVVLDDLCKPPHRISVPFSVSILTLILF